MTAFFNAIAVAFLRHVNLEVFLADALKSNFYFQQIKCILVASPGFLREQFMEYFWQYVEKEGLKQQISTHKSKFLLVHSSSGFKVLNLTFKRYISNV